MDKTIAWRAYSKYLRDKGYSEESKKGNPSTTYDYPTKVERICKKEGFANLDDLGEHINEIIQKYGQNGTEAKYGEQSHGGILKSLELFREFYICFDSEEVL